MSLLPFPCSHTMLNLRNDIEITTSTLYLNIYTCGFRETCLKLYAVCFTLLYLGESNYYCV